MKVSEILKRMSLAAPEQTAEEWDNVGLLIGDPQAEVPAAIVSIDLDSAALDAADRAQAKLIINHHPCIFPKGRGASQILADSHVHRAIRSGISVIAAHTNFDQCALEVIDQIAKGWVIQPRGRLTSKSETLTKLVVFVPESHLDAVRTAICQAGAGVVGNYDHCSFAAPGQGTFRGGKGTRPYIGQSGELERAAEFRLETVLPSGLRKPVLDALRAAHPYEEIAYDLFLLENPVPRHGIVRGLGYGFWGEFESPLRWADFEERVRKTFQVEHFLAPAHKPQLVRRAAFSPGKGTDFIRAARAAECSVFVTGEVGYHASREAAEQGLTVLELGHPQSERFFVETVAAWLRQWGVDTQALLPRP